MDHCVAKIVEIVRTGRDDRRSVLQLGYNLGRLSEITGLGREPFWDRWKDAIAAWDLETLRQLAEQLRRDASSWAEEPRS
jgi:hypothetical protein